MIYDYSPVVILLFAATLAPFDGSSANADCGVVSRGVVRSVKERRVVAAAEKRSWIDDVACNSSLVLELRLEEERPLGENAAAPPQAIEATKTVRKETILFVSCCCTPNEEPILFTPLRHGMASTSARADAIS